MTKKPFYQAQNEYRVLEELRTQALESGDTKGAEVWSKWSENMEKEASLGHYDSSIQDSRIGEHIEKQRQQINGLGAILDKYAS